MLKATVFSAVFGMIQAGCAHQDVNVVPAGSTEVPNSTPSALAVDTSTQTPATPNPTPPKPPLSAKPGGPVWSNQIGSPSINRDIGIKECDEYLLVLDRCIGGQLVRDAVAGTRIAFLQAAENPDPAVRAALAESCKTASEQTRLMCPGTPPLGVDPLTSRN